MRLPKTGLETEKKLFLLTVFLFTSTPYGKNVLEQLPAYVVQIKDVDQKT